MMLTLGVAEPTVKTSSIKIETENVVHAQILKEYCETGKLPEGKEEDMSPLAGRTDSRNVRFVEGETFIVLNGGRYRVKNEEGTWENRPVNAREVYTKMQINLLGEVKAMGGVEVITPNGDKLSFPSDEPQGAFLPSSLQGKIMCTQTAIALAEKEKITVVLPHYTAAQVFEVDGSQVAAGVYEVPKFIPYSEYITNPAKQYVALYTQYTAIGDFMRAGYIHPQYHGGNRGVIEHPTQGVVPVLLDWEDAYDVSNYRTDIMVDLAFTPGVAEIMVTPREKAEIYSLVKAIEVDFLQLLYEKPANTEEMKTIILERYLSPILLGYHGIHQEDGVNTELLLKNFLDASQEFFPNKAINFWQLAYNFAASADRVKIVDRLAEMVTIPQDVVDKAQKDYLSDILLLRVSMAIGLVLMKRKPLPLLADRK